MKKSFAIIVLCLIALPAFGESSDLLLRDISIRIRERIIRVIRNVVSNADALQPPLPAPAPKP